MLNYISKEIKENGITRIFIYTREINQIEYTQNKLTTLVKCDCDEDVCHSLIVQFTDGSRQEITEGDITDYDINKESITLYID